MDKETILAAFPSGCFVYKINIADFFKAQTYCAKFECDLYCTQLETGNYIACVKPLTDELLEEIA